MIKILIADDHAIVREGLKQILAEQSGMKVAGEASNYKELFQLLPEKEWSLIILDIHMPGKSGLDALKDVRQQYPKLPVLILSMYSEEQYGLRAIKAGASGFLEKVSAPEELVKAIQKIISGDKYISARLVDKMASSLGSHYESYLHESLSDRELQIMCQIASGKSAEDIAKELIISVHTVYSYRNRILDKMKMKSNVELTQYAIQNNLIKL
ncbi:MAG: response regulator transcription factor [Calditrichaceae bacterium]|jgi:two-component system, NarL family, invasion response regulator UvrY